VFAFGLFNKRQPAVPADSGNFGTVFRCGAGMARMRDELKWQARPRSAKGVFDWTKDTVDLTGERACAPQP
jgi:hypothetical protein